MVLASGALVGCGGDEAVTVESVQVAFSNPTGSVDDTTATDNLEVQYTTAQNAQGVASIFGLTQAGASSSVLSRVVEISDQFAKRSFGQTDDDFSCISDQVPTDGSTSFTVNLDDCTDLGVTGSLDYEFEGDQNQFRIIVTANNVCETGGDSCVSGTVVTEVVIEGDSSTSYSILNLTSTSGGETTNVRSAYRINSDGFAWVFFVEDSTGAQVSFVVVEESSTGDTVTVTVTGAGGETKQFTWTRD